VPQVVIDTDLLSEILKGVNPVVVSAHEAYTRIHRVLSFASVSAFEILFGYGHKSATAKIERTEALFASNEEIVPAPEDYRLAAIASSLSRHGKSIGLVDPVIAACAIRRGYGVASGNTKHFDYIRDAGYSFHLENWRNP
jgi:tRNA(fMet)-specific endonuclease VapC